MDDRLRDAIENSDRQAVQRMIDENPELAREAYDDADGTHDGEGGSQGSVSAALFAVYRRQREIAEMLLEARDRPPDVFEAAAMGLDNDLDELLHDADATTVEETSPDGFTALHLAAYFGHAEIVRRLLRAGADVHAVSRNDSRLHPLNSGAAGGDVGVVEALLAAGANPDARQAGGYTPLMGAAAAGSERITDRLLEAGADPASTSEDGRTAADLARERGHPDLAERLDAADTG